MADTPTRPAAAVPANPTVLAAPAAPAEPMPRRRRVPNATLLDHHGRPVRFDDDVLRGRTVLVNVMYTVCSNICSPATRNLIEARRLLGRDAERLHFVSMTLTPLSDPPEALRSYRQRHGIADDWTFLTGRVEAVEQVQKAMGFLSDNEGDGLLGHSAMAKLCDDRRLNWGHVNTLLSPRSIARMIRFELV